MQALWDTAPRIAGIPILVNLPAFGIVMVVTWLLLRGAKETSRVNNIMVVIKLAALALFIGVGVMNIDTAATCRLRRTVYRHPSGCGDRVLRLHRV